MMVSFSNGNVGTHHMFPWTVVGSSRSCHEGADGQPRHDMYPNYVAASWEKVGEWTLCFMSFDRVQGTVTSDVFRAGPQRVKGKENKVR